MSFSFNTILLIFVEQLLWAWPSPKHYSEIKQEQSNSHPHGLDDLTEGMRGRDPQREHDPPNDSHRNKIKTASIIFRRQTLSIATSEPLRKEPLALDVSY